ncbi:MAG TPA: DUF2098 family protein [Halobacteria archaeon]|jgi:hypothetical protein|nr:DUF2098 family protein [Halobacteria archaeon]
MIEIGDVVIYANTGTKGIVKEIKEKDGVRWALLDNELYYVMDMLKQADIKETVEENDISISEIKAKLDDEKKIDLSKISDEFCGGGG